MPQIVAHVPFHRWEVTDGKQMQRATWWEARAILFRDWCLRSLQRQTRPLDGIVVSFIDRDANPDNPCYRVAIEAGCQILARPYQEWRYPLAPNQHDHFCHLFSSRFSYFVILSIDSDDCYAPEVAAAIDNETLKPGLCLHWDYGYEYGIKDEKMAWFGQATGPPSFFAKVYTRAAMNGPKTMAEYRDKWRFNCYHHETVKCQVNRPMPNGQIFQLVHGHNASIGWKKHHTAKRIKHWITNPDERRAVLERFGHPELR